MPENEKMSMNTFSSPGMLEYEGFLMIVTIMLTSEKRGVGKLAVFIPPGVHASLNGANTAFG